MNLQDLDVPTVEQCVKEDALEVQDIRELGLGWAWFVNDLRAFLPAWQDMELATPSTEEPVTQIAGDVPVEPLPLQADATQMELELQAYERPLAVTPFGTPEPVPDWHDSHAMRAYVPPSSLGHWIRTDLGVRTFQGLGKMLPEGTKRFAVLQRMLTPNRSLSPYQSYHVKSIFRCHCIDAVFQVVVHTLAPHVIFRPRLSIASYPCPLLLPLFLRSCLLPLFLRGGGVPCFLSPSLSSPSLSVLLRGPTFSKFSTGGASESTFGLRL